jgi:hypothetical protein
MAGDEVALSNNPDENEIAISLKDLVIRPIAQRLKIGPTLREHTLPKSFQCQYKVDIMPGNSTVGSYRPRPVRTKRSSPRQLTDSATPYKTNVEPLA